MIIFIFVNFEPKNIKNLLSQISIEKNLLVMNDLKYTYICINGKIIDGDQNVNL